MLQFLKPVLYVIGLFLSGLGVAMVLPGLVDLAVGDRDAEVFFVAATITIFIGSMLAMTNRGDVSRIQPRQAYLLTTLSWVSVCVASALPFWLSRLGLSFTDSVFEATSGLTTTGATVIAGLDNAPSGILLWRGLLHGIGGIGIVVMGVLILPFLKVGGQQLFQTESSDKSERPFPRFTQVVIAIAAVYFALILFCASALWLAGMAPLDASVHAFAAVATGGFSTKDASLGFWNSATFDWILIVFMISGALPLTWYVRLLRNGPSALKSDSQVWVFLSVLAVCIGTMLIWVWFTQEMPFWRVVTLTAFNVTSIVTDTGFAHEDYGQWGAFAVACFLFYPFIGGCTGSTAGAIKIFRWHVLWHGIKRTIKRSISPNRIVAVTYNDRPVPPEAIDSVQLFIALYLATWVLGTIAVSTFGVDVLSASSAVAACMANSGPGLGEIVGPVGNYAPLPDGAKWTLSLLMLLGRLELLTVLVLVFPDFWRT